MSDSVQIAEALVADLTATAFSRPFTARRAYLPLVELSAMADLHVTVVVAGRTTEPISRSLLQVDHRLEVAMQQRLGGDGLADGDPLLALVEEIADHLAGHRLAGAPEAAWVKTEHGPLVDPGHLNELRQFTSLLILTYRTWET
jgi:hypothetical protein